MLSMKQSLARRNPPEHDNPADRLVLRVLRRSVSLPVHLASTHKDASDFGVFRCRPSGQIEGNRPAQIAKHGAVDVLPVPEESAACRRCREPSHSSTALACSNLSRAVSIFSRSGRNLILKEPKPERK